MKMNRFFVALIVVAASLMCGTASEAAVWFHGYLDPSNDYKYYGFSDWDTPLFGAGIQPDSDLFGIAAPSHRVDGHVILEADGFGSAKVIESTGSYSATAGFQIGDILPISFQDTNWFSNPYIPSPPASDTRGDYSPEFINIVSGLVSDTAAVPEPTSLALWSILTAVAATASYRRRGNKRCQERMALAQLATCDGQSR